MITTDKNIGKSLNEMILLCDYINLISNFEVFDDEKINIFLENSYKVLLCFSSITCSTIVRVLKLVPLCQSEERYYFGFDNIYFGIEKCQDLDNYASLFNRKIEKISKEDEKAIQKINNDYDYITRYNVQMMVDKNRKNVLKDFVDKISNLRINEVASYLIYNCKSIPNGYDILSGNISAMMKAFVDYVNIKYYWGIDNEN